MAVNLPIPVRGGDHAQKMVASVAKCPLALSGESVHLLGLVLNDLNQNGSQLLSLLWGLDARAVAGIPGTWPRESRICQVVYTG